VTKCDICIIYKYCFIRTSSGSTSLNSMPLPVHTIHVALFGSSNNVTRNCHSCNAPLRWGGCCGTAIPAYPPVLPSWPEDTTVFDSGTPPVYTTTTTTINNNIINIKIWLFDYANLYIVLCIMFIVWVGKMFCVSCRWCNL